jgi:hypothetical protein
MAVAYTVTNVHSVGNLKAVHGTFTTAAGDSGGTLAPATHGLNYIVDYVITLDTGGLNTPTPKATISSGTITWTVDDTLGYSGKFYVLGR